MFNNYLTTAWRNLLRYKIYSFINITGLAIGLAVCMMIVLYVGHESNYDQFHKNADRIYLIRSKLNIGGDSVFMPYLNYSAGPEVVRRDPSVESFLRIRKDPQNVIIQNPQTPAQKFAESKFLFADSNFFDFFSFTLRQGNKNLVLQQPMSVVVSKDAAQKYFGNTDVVGKTIRYNNEYDLQIRGVSESSPSNSSIDFDFVASLSSMKLIKEQRELVSSEKNDFITYFLVKKGGNIFSVENTLLGIAKTQKSGELNWRYVSTPLDEIHLTADIDYANLKYLKIFPLVAALVLLLALINYASLSTARSAARAKEIGVRKVLGAGKKLIATQFFMESALYTVIAFAIGFVLCIMLQPVFFNFLQIDIDASFLYYPEVLVAFAILFIVTVCVAGAYPSLLLSAYKPVTVLYGKFVKQGSINIRKFFTVFQFAIAVMFIVAGIVIQKQMHFFRRADTGVQRENVMMIPFSQEVSKHYNAFKQDASSMAAITEMSVALHPLYKGYDMMGLVPPGSKEMILMSTLDVDQRFISMLGIKWKIPPIDPLFYKDKNNVIVNEAAVERLKLGANPINTKVDQFVVAGVVKDFNWTSLQNKIEAVFISVSASDDASSLIAKKGGCLFVKANKGTNLPSFIAQMKNIHKKYDAETPFEYYFMDDVFNDMYKAEDRLAKILTVFTGFAILIACLGLLGLITFIAVQKTKEIGIRKVLGASVNGIAILISGSFFKLIFLACLIAMPLAWYIMNKWLEGFAYRTSISWWVFGAAALAVVFIALITISYEAIKAAIANPIKSLRTE